MRSSPRLARVAIALCFGALVGCAPAKRPFTAPLLDPLPRELDYHPNLRVSRLGNGLVVAIAPDHKTNLVQIDLRLRIGATEDPAGKEGLAHLVEHIVFGLRSSPSEPSLADRLRDAAIHYNAWTTWDATHFTSTGIEAQIDKLLGVEKGRLSAGCQHVPPELFERERAVVIQEIEWRHDWTSDVRTAVRNAIMGSEHMYARPAGGDAQSLSNITRQDVCDFLVRYYTPGNAILVVTGNVAPDVVAAQIEAAFGQLPRQEAPPRKPAGSWRFRPGGLELTIDGASPTVMISFRLPPWGSREASHAAPLTQLMEERLHPHVGRGILTGVDITHLGDTRDRVRTFILTVDSLEQIDAAIHLFFAERSLMLRDLDEDSFATTRSNLSTAIVRHFEDFGERGKMIADYLQHTDHERFMLEELEVLRGLRVDVFRSYAQSLWRRDRAHITRLIPRLGQRRLESSRAIAIRPPAIDVMPWSAPVDPAEADGPVPYPVARIRHTLRRHVLANGLNVLLSSDFGHPTIDIRVIFPVGDRSDPPGKRGLATWASSLLQHDFSISLDPRTKRDVVEVLKMGGALESSSNDRTTVFRSTGLSIYGDGLLWQLHWLLQSGVYSERRLRRARLLVSSESGAARTPSERIDRHYERLIKEGLYGRGHPYASPDDWNRGLRSLTIGDLEDFRARYYRPRGATLIVTGRFDQQRMLDRISRLFGSWPNQRAPAARNLIPEVTSRSAPLRYFLPDDDAAQPELTVGFPIPGDATDRRGVRLVIEQLLNQRLGSVRDQLGASYGVNVEYDLRERGAALIIRSSVAPERAARAVRHIFRELEDLRAGKGLREDFIRARRKALETILADSASAPAVAAELSLLVSLRLPGNYFERLAHDIAHLSLAVVREQLAADLAQADELVIFRAPPTLGAQVLRQAGIDHFESL